MSLAHKLYKIGTLVTKDEVRDIIEVKDFENIDTYRTLQIDFKNGLPIIKETSIDSFKTMFSKKIGGTSNSYYLYPNFEFQKEGDLVKKFKAAAYTLENSIMIYADPKHQQMVKPLVEYIKNYQDDKLGLSKYEKGNYFLILTINGKTFYELMPEVWENYYECPVDFFQRDITKKEYLILKEKDNDRVFTKEDNKGKLKYYENLYNIEIDFIAHKKTLCGYNPDVKFFTYDNYHNDFKPNIINKLPMSKETAIAIKKGWMYAITHLKFYHKGLEYIIIPSMVNFEKSIYQKMLRYLKSSNDMQTIASKENSFLRRLSKQIETFNSSGIALDILFTDVNVTNLSVKIFATLEEVLPSRINTVVAKMKDFHISDSPTYNEGQDTAYLKDFFLHTEKTADAKKLKGLQNRIKQEKIELAKLLLGYKRIKYETLLSLFELYREISYNFKESKVEKRMTETKKKDGKVKEWITYPDSFVKKEDNILHFLQSIDAINNKGDKVWAMI